MTKPEQQILFSLNGKFDSFLENHAEYKKEMKEQEKKALPKGIPNYDPSVQPLLDVTKSLDV